MSVTIGIICLICGIVGMIFILYTKDSEVEIASVSDDTGRLQDFSRSVLLFGDSINDRACTQQRKEIKPILSHILNANFTILETYGNAAPSQNGYPLTWVDTAFLRRTFQAEKNFCLIYLDDLGRMSFRTIQPIAGSVILELLAIKHPATPPPLTPPPDDTDHLLTSYVKALR